MTEWTLWTNFGVFSDQWFIRGLMQKEYAINRCSVNEYNKCNANNNKKTCASIVMQMKNRTKIKAYKCNDKLCKWWLVRTCEQRWEYCRSKF